MSLNIGILMKRARCPRISARSRSSRRPSTSSSSMREVVARSGTRRSPAAPRGRSSRRCRAERGCPPGTPRTGRSCRCRSGNAGSCADHSVVGSRVVRDPKVLLAGTGSFGSDRRAGRCDDTKRPTADWSTGWLLCCILATSLYVVVRRGRAEWSARSCAGRQRSGVRDGTWGGPQGELGPGCRRAGFRAAGDRSAGTVRRCEHLFAARAGDRLRRRLDSTALRARPSCAVGSEPVSVDRPAGSSGLRRAGDEGPFPPVTAGPGRSRRWRSGGGVGRAALVLSEACLSRGTFAEATEQIPRYARSRRPVCGTRSSLPRSVPAVSSPRWPGPTAVSWWLVQAALSAAAVVLPDVDDVRVRRGGR